MLRPPLKMSTEKAIQQRVLMLSSESIRLFRNNCGLATYRSDDGRDMMVKYGVANPGGSDIIGIRTIIRDGAKIGQFVALEVKEGRRQPTPAQKGFLEVVQSLGGLAAVVRSEEEAKRLLNEE